MKATLIHICFFLTFCALTCRAATYYVSLAGTNNSPPFTNSWASAGTDIVAIAASAPAGSGVNTVLVSNGTYYLTNQITPAWGVIIKSFSGRDVTIIDGNYPNYTNRCFKFAGSGNTLDGFTIRNGFSTNSAWNEGGGGVYCNKTYIYNCRIINNVTSNATSQGGGGGILAFGNGCIVTNCDIIANTAYGSGGGLWSQEDGNVVNISGCNIISNKSNGSGGGIRTDSHCSISNCVITYNSADAGGGVLTYNDTIIRNCLVFGNSAKNAGGVYIYSARALHGPNQVENCTIVSNYASQAGGGLYQYKADQTNHIENCIVYYNTAGDGASSNLYFQAATPTTGNFECVNTCIAPTSSVPYEYSPGVPLNNTGNIECDPLLVNYPAGNCRLAAGSPCINAGTNRAWMTGAVDLDGRMRQRYGTVDMGAYEAIYGGTIFTGH